MSRTDFFSKYSQIYGKARVREIVPGGPFVRQLVDIPPNDLNIGIFFQSKKKKIPSQGHIGNPIPLEVAEQE